MQVRSEAMSISSAHGHVRRMLQLSETRIEVLLELVIVANGSQPAAGFGREKMEAKGYVWRRDRSDKVCRVC